MKLELSEPIVIAQGPTLEEAGWGPWQFPQLRMDENRVLYAGVNDCPDNWVAEGKDDNVKWFVSHDMGKTWAPSNEDEAAKGLPMAENGDKFLATDQAPTEVDPKIFEGKEMLYRLYLDDNTPFFDYYRLSDFKEDEVNKNVMFYRLKKGAEKRDKVFPKVVGDDGCCVERPYGENLILTPKLFGRMRKAPDGSLWQMHYSRGIVDGGFSDVFTAFYYRSADNGESWELVSTLDPRKTEGAVYYCEQDIAWIDEKRAVTSLRSMGLHIATSDDGGRTWSKTKQVAPFAVDPAICAFPNGAVICTYGRPGFLITASFDGKGEVWEEPIEIISTEDLTYKMNDITHAGNCSAWGTCSYSDIVRISDNEAYVIYTDYYVPDSEGIKRKSLMLIKVTVVE